MNRSLLGRLAVAVAASAVGVDCNYWQDGPATTMRVCVSTSVVVVDRRSEDFTSSCGAAPCDAQVEGTVSYVDSLLPGDRAVALEPGARIAFRWNVMGDAEGSTLSINARCEGGGTLRVGGDRVTYPRLSAELPVGAAWVRHEWPMRAAIDVHDSAGAALVGSTEVEVTVANAGGTRCHVDRLRYVTTARVCTEYRDVTTRGPGRWCTVADPCPSGDGGVTVRPDVGF